MIRARSIPSRYGAPGLRLFLSAGRLAGMLALPLLPAFGDPCCLDRSCTDRSPAECLSLQGTVGYCRIGEPCGALTCDGTQIQPIRAVMARKVSGGKDVELSWQADPDADSYFVRFARQKWDLPVDFEDMPVPGSTPSTIPESLHRDAVAGAAGEYAYFYQVTGHCTLTAPIGACCLWEGRCIEGATSSECASARRSVYQGENTRCTDGLCQGACCSVDGLCMDGFDFEGCLLGIGEMFCGTQTTCAEIDCHEPCDW